MECSLFFCLSGAGGIRTLVQTGKPYAFYMLILAFIFVLQQDPSHQPQPYPLNFIGLSRPNLTIPDLPAPLDPQIRDNILGAMSRSPT